MPSAAASLPAAEPCHDDPAIRLAVVVRSAGRQLNPHEIAERIGSFEMPELLRYLQALRLAKACLESVQLLASARIVGVSEAHALGRTSVDDLPDLIDTIIHDTDLAAEIDRISTAIDIKEDR